MKYESPPTHLDVKAFAQSAGSVAGHDLLSKYERLMLETQGLGADLPLNWAARGELLANEAGVDQLWVHLSVDVRLPMTCQRCLGPVSVPVLVDRAFRFVDSEEAAEAQDEEAEEDVLALSRDFDLLALVEDEVLMELPVVPRHDECPVAVTLEIVDPAFEAASAEKRNPFSVLAKLQAGKSS